MQLRPYQVDLVASLRDGYRSGLARQLAVSPTGSGKTVLFSFITQSAASRGKRVMILAHRAEILNQISSTLSRVGVGHGFIRAGEPMQQSLPVQVAGVQSLIRRFDKVKTPDLVIVDEAHHSCASQWVEVFARYDRAQFLGVTATPERLDGKGLGDFYQRLVMGPSVQWLIDNGFLAKPVYYAPKQAIDVSVIKKTAGDFNKGEAAEVMDKPTITGDIVAHYRRICPGAKAVAFCITLDHAKHVAETFNAAGIRAATIDGTLTDTERSQRVRDLESGAISVLTSCEIVSEGFDLPAVGAAILIRPTTSLSLHLQQVGRALRPCPGKDKAIILDHVGNCLRHGLAEEEREWTLDGYTKKKRNKEAELGTKQCKSCFAIFVGDTCPECGTEREAASRTVEHVAGELSEIDMAARIAMARQRKAEERTCRTFEDFKKLGAIRGYKPGWAHFRWQKSHFNRQPQPA